MRSGLLLAVLAALAIGVSANCRPDKNCITCARAKCTKCVEGYGPNKAGKCVQCKVPGKLGWTCTRCSGDKPGFCTRCQDWEGEQPTGVYATKYGRCRYCPDKNCHLCATKSGRCTECNRGYGLVKGKCVKCADKNCITCDRNAAICTSCYTGYAPNTRGRCAACRDPNCDSCTKPGRCEYCSVGYKLVGGKCVKA